LIKRAIYLLNNYYYFHFFDCTTAGPPAFAKAMAAKTRPHDLSFDFTDFKDFTDFRLI